MNAIESQAKIHDEIAHLYSLERVNRTVFNRAFNRYYNRLVLSMFPADRDVRVLDLMGGTGILTHAVLEAGYGNVVLLDLSEGMLRFARETLRSGVRFCAADAMVLPFDGESFDVIVCRGGLHHLPDLGAGLREIHRVLKKGGTFLAYDPCDDLPPVRWLRRAMYLAFSFFDAEHERGLTSAEVRGALTAAGFAVAETRKFGFVGYIVSGMEAHLFPRVFGAFPHMHRLAERLCGIDARLEGARFLLATSFRAVKHQG